MFVGPPGCRNDQPDLPPAYGVRLLHCGIRTRRLRGGLLPQADTRQSTYRVGKATQRQFL